MAEPNANEEQWRRILLGELPALNWLKRLMGFIPSEPRCKLCRAPFGRPGRLIIRVVGIKQSPFNRRLCTMCIRALHKHPGGAEIDVTVLFADVRGSTRLAERAAPGEFGQLLARFYGTAARVIDRYDGLVDKFVGDEAVALFIPGLAGPAHAERAIAAARELLLETGHAEGAPWIPLGIGIHTGTSYVGTVGEGDAVDFTAVGDTVNTAARLRAEAGVGEVLISDAAAKAAGVETSGLERRTLELRGREQSVEAWVEAVRPVSVAV
jgi:adenylate cyclase